MEEAEGALVVCGVRGTSRKHSYTAAALVRRWTSDRTAQDRGSQHKRKMITPGYSVSRIDKFQ